MTEKQPLPKLESLHRIYKLPVVESGVNIATGLYGKIKNSNPLTRWYLGAIEGGLSFAIDTSLIAAPLFAAPISAIDTIVCMGLDQVEHHIPAINYPPAELFSKTKIYVSSKIVQPVLKRAESVKEFSVHGATKYGEVAASHIDAALDVADQYVDKYLPDTSDTADKKTPEHNGDSKTIQTIEHVNRLGRKLQRRLTSRTIAEAKALQRQSIHTAQILMKLAELMIKDPKQFMARMITIWEHLSQDEPENQVPPANIEQLIEMITRETARRFVHLTNFSVSKASQLPGYTINKIQVLAHQADILLDQILKTVHLERVKAVIVRSIQNQLHHFNITLRDVQLLIENLISGLIGRTHQATKTQEMPMPLHTLSPVAQSPERTPENCKREQNQKESQKDSKQKHTTSTTPKKEKKQKTPENNVSSTNTETKSTGVETKPSDQTTPSQPTSNGETLKSVQ